VGCARLDAVTYPSATIAKILSDRFGHVKIDSQEQRSIAARFHLLWTPTLVALDAHGAVLRTVIGFLPPGDLAAELTLMDALWALRRGHHDHARALLQAVRRDHAGAAVISEAHYWEGVVAYRQTHDKDDLWAVWRELVAAHPGSAWARRTTLLDPVPAP
jgi:hypothetical protein